MFIAITIFPLQSLFAQSSLTYGWYININGGISQLHGDIQTSDNPLNKLKNETGPGGGIKIGKYINSVFTAYFQFHGSDMKGLDEKKDREFSSDMLEGRLGLTLNFTNLFFGKKERLINFYGTAGAGVVFFRSEAYMISSGELINDYGYLGTTNKQKTSRERSFLFPLGAGFDIKLSPQWYLNLETAVGIFTTDKLDATEKGAYNDAYNFTSLGLTYYFKERKKGRIPQSRPLEEKPVIVADPYANEYINLVHKFPAGIKSFDEFEMQSEVHKGKINGSGTLTQVLPVGFNVLDTAIANAKSEFNMYTLRLQWDSLPADSVFTVSYRVKLDRIFGTLPLASILYLQKTGKEYKFKTTVDIIRWEEPVAVKEVAAETKKEDSIPAISIVEYRIQVSASFKTRIPLRELAGKISPREEIREDFQNNWYSYTVGSFNSYEEAKEYMQKRVAEFGLKEAYIVVFYKGKKLKSLGELKQYVPEVTPVQPEVKKEEYCYRVQILAMMGKGVDPVSLKQQYGLEEDVNEEIYHNWHKYTVGPCTAKPAASLLLKSVKAKGVTGAFIVTYKDGERVILE
jgi:hypothetical protein